MDGFHGMSKAAQVEISMIIDTEGVMVVGCVNGFMYENICLSVYLYLGKRKLLENGDSILDYHFRYDTASARISPCCSVRGACQREIRCDSALHWRVCRFHLEQCLYCFHLDQRPGLAHALGGRDPGSEYQYLTGVDSSVHYGGFNTEMAPVQSGVGSAAAVCFHGWLCVWWYVDLSVF